MADLTEDPLRPATPAANFRVSGPAVIVEGLNPLSLSSGGVLPFDTFLYAKQRRACKASERTLVLKNCRVLDVVSGAYIRPAQNIVIQNGVIQSMEPVTKLSVKNPDACIVINCEGRVVMPGLCDAHVHCTAVTANLAALMSMSESYVAAKSAGILHQMISRGFTTVRDAGGADFGLAEAVEEGVILGPRLLFTGHALSQTGGHGDMRQKGEDLCACGAALRGIGRVCDGDAEVRRAARDELRKGAHCIKVMASGGVASPTDRLSNTQFSTAELRAIVEEAEAAGTYVCAHAYMPSAIKRAVECGVRSIEHGNWLDEECAEMMAKSGVFLVPTLVTYQQLMKGGEAAGMPRHLVDKVGDCVAQGLSSLSLAQAAGVTMCYGSDLLGDLHPHQGQEFVLRAGRLPSLEVIRSATINCAALFKMQDQIGQVREGYLADLVVVEGDPLADVALLADAANLKLVMKEGLLAKAPYHSMEMINKMLFDPGFE